MPLFQAKRKNPINANEEHVFVDAVDRTAAIATLRNHGWAAAEWLDSVPAGFDLPADATVLEGVTFRRPKKPSISIAESALVQRPVSTLALGVGLGIVIAVLVLTVLHFVLVFLGVGVVRLLG